MTKAECTSKVQRLRTGNETDAELCKRIGISQPTLYTRLKTHNWKIGEIAIIKTLK